MWACQGCLKWFFDRVMNYSSQNLAKALAKFFYWPGGLLRKIFDIYGRFGWTLDSPEVSTYVLFLLPQIGGFVPKTEASRDNNFMAHGWNSYQSEGPWLLSVLWRLPQGRKGFCNNLTSASQNKLMCTVRRFQPVGKFTLKLHPCWTIQCY